MFSRSFFSLPDVSSLSPFANNKAEAPPPGPKTYHERKILPYTRKQLYAIVEDIESYHNYVPFCTESRITSPPTPSSKGNGQTELEAELKVGFMSISEDYTSRVTCTPFESVEARAVSSIFKTLDTTWRFQPSSSSSPHSSNSSLVDEKSPSHIVRETDTNDSDESGSETVDDDEGPTLVILDLAYEFASPHLAMVASMFFGQVSKMTVKAFEKRCLEVYGPGTK
ncbi:hypothetical protein SISNIDRAFT_456918 [Sistotremastrum niveocremeum HHB9708]|uniref:Coenzyme Q-binding protein COQ10 START domain-containing protein n=1 Tax=Sistotremastrum niveocremeum HHB9708 TaxID=1314777 RepID=A0A164SAP7_9AGAM|nr:hypothetical protein SISNIDRAFT_456918 [Sistotremastrum niveocremeum HHB9708]